MPNDKSKPVTEPAFTTVEQVLERANDLWSWIDVTKSHGAFLRNNRPNAPRTKVRVKKRLLNELIKTGRIEHSLSEVYHLPTREIYVVPGHGSWSAVALRHRILEGMRRIKNAA